MTKNARKKRIGDIITILKRPDEIETLNIRVTALKYFKTFTEVADEYSIGRLYSPNYTREEYLDLFRIFYSDEEISEYGVVAIEFELI